MSIKVARIHRDLALCSPASVPNFADLNRYESSFASVRCPTGSAAGRTLISMS